MAASISDPDMTVLRASKAPGDMIIHVRGGQGSNKGKVKHGLTLTENTSFCISATDVLVQLKKQIRKKYGLFSQMQLGTLRLVDAAGQLGNVAQKKDLADEITLSCIYISAPGNPRAFQHTRHQSQGIRFYHFYSSPRA